MDWRAVIRTVFPCIRTGGGAMSMRQTKIYEPGALSTIFHSKAVVITGKSLKFLFNVGVGMGAGALAYKGLAAGTENLGAPAAVVNGIIASGMGYFTALGYKHMDRGIVTPFIHDVLRVWRRP